MKLNLIEVLESKVNLTKRQALTYQVLRPEKKILYLMTHLGQKNNHLIVSRVDQPPALDRTFPKTYVQGELLNFWRRSRLKLYDTKVFKTPDATTGWYGVEIECYLPRANFNLAGDGDCNGDCREDCSCDEDCCECEHTEYCGGLGSYIDDVADKLREIKIKNIQVVSDGSLGCTDEVFGLEIKVLFKLNDYSNLEKVCKFLNENGAAVDRTCGLHVHIDSRDIAKSSLEIQKKTAQKYYAAMSILKSMLPKSRRNARYCMDGYSFDDRYHAVNAKSLEKHGTIEIRSHSGTTDLTKILNWVKILDAVKNHAWVDNRTVSKFCKGMDLSEELTSYVFTRIAKFNSMSDVENDASCEDAA